MQIISVMLVPGNEKAGCPHEIRSIWDALFCLIKNELQ